MIIIILLPLQDKQPLEAHEILSKRKEKSQYGY